MSYAWNIAHSAEKKAYDKRYRESRRETASLYQRGYRSSHKLEKRAYCRDYQRSRKASDLNFKLRGALRDRLARAIKGNAKAGSAVRDLGCTIPELKQHLEAQFKPGMSWDNHGIQGWHIDHIKPLAKFDLTDRSQFLEACHYTNLQPLWAEENIKKGARV